MGSMRIVIPTRDSGRWVSTFLLAYRAAGVEPFYVVDARSSDDTLDCLKTHKAEFVVFTPHGDFPEAGMIEFGSKACGSQWVLRLDDDEFPSGRLLKWLDELPSNSLNPVFHIGRRELFAREGQIYYSRSRGRFQNYAKDTIHPQPRVYRVDAVEYVEQLHTSGIVVPKVGSIAPNDAFFIHLNCLLRTPEERLRKVELYERILPAATIAVADEYLPELFSLEHHRASSDGLDEFRPLLEKLPLNLNPTIQGLDAAACQTLHDAVDAHARRLAALEQRPLVDADRVFAYARRLPRGAWRPCARLLTALGWESGGRALARLDAHLSERERKPGGDRHAPRRT